MNFEVPPLKCTNFITVSIQILEKEMAVDENENSSQVDESQAVAAFSLVKYENPEIIDTQDSADVEEEVDACDEVLESILPPREWEHNGRLWRQRVSASPATRYKLANLHLFSKKVLLLDLASVPPR